MSFRVNAVSLLLLNSLTTTQSLHIKSINVPKYAKVSIIEAIILAQDLPLPFKLGDPVRLECDFEEGRDQLYSVKWYKDNMEFYRSAFTIPDP